MATYWVRADGSGVDAVFPGRGGSYALAWATISYALTQLNSIGVKGDILNLANDGNHVVTVHGQMNAAALTGTSFSDPGLIIQGVNPSGNPALTTCVDPGAAAGARFLDLRNNARYFIVRGLKLDFSTTTGGTDIVRYTGATSGPALIEACWIKGFADNAIGSGQRPVMDGVTTGPPDYGIVRYSYIENCIDTLDCALGSTTKKLTIHHCVISFTGDWATASFNGTLQLGNTPVNASDDVEFYQNTIYVNVSGGDAITGIFDWGPASGAAGTIALHSNYGWIETTGAGTVTQVFAGSPGSTATFTTSTIGFNTIRFGPSVIAADNSGGLYEAPYDGGVDPKLSDSVAYTTAAATLFNAPASSWTWTDVNSTGYDIPLPRDLRPLLNLTSSSTGGVPGALPRVPVADETDLSIDVGASTLTPDPTETLAVTVTISNTILAATGVTASVVVPTGLELMSATPDTGSYNPTTGVWTVGTVGIGDTALLALVVRVNLDQGGLTIPFPVSISAFATPSLDTNLANNTDTLTLTIGVIKKGPGEPPPPPLTNEKKLPPEGVTDEKKLIAGGFAGTIIMNMFADVGPNNFNSFGVGASHAARISDLDDSTGIRTTLGARQDRFSIDGSLLPVGITEVTGMTIHIRHNLGAPASNPIFFNVYIAGVPFDGLSVFQLVNTTTTDEDFVFPFAVPMAGVDVPNLQFEVNTGAGWLGASRWTINNLTIELNYVIGVNEPEKIIISTAGTEKDSLSFSGTATKKVHP